MPLIVPVARMLPTRVQSPAVGSGVSASVSATYASGPTQGNLLVAMVYANVASTNISMTTTGYTLLDNRDFSSAPTSGVAIFSKIAVSGESTTVTAAATGANNMRIHVVEYSNIASSTPITHTTGLTTAGTTNTLSMAFAGGTPVVVVCMVATAGSDGGWVSWTSGVATIQTDARSESGEWITTAGALGNTVGTWTTTRDAGGVLASFLGRTFTGIDSPGFQAINRAGMY